jgi:hypothetical protein
MTNIMLNRSAAEGLARDANISGRRVRFGTVSDLPLVRGIVDVTMVGLLGGGPRLAMRAARVFLEDSYVARSATDRELTNGGRANRDD